jgi:hypothetical protein
LGLLIIPKNLPIASSLSPFQSTYIVLTFSCLPTLTYSTKFQTNSCWIWLISHFYYFTWLFEFKLFLIEFGFQTSSLTSCDFLCCLKLFREFEIHTSKLF